MAKEDLIRKLVETRAELNNCLKQRKTLSSDIKGCKAAEENLIRELEQNIQNEQKSKGESA